MHKRAVTSTFSEPTISSGTISTAGVGASIRINLKHKRDCLSMTRGAQTTHVISKPVNGSHNLFFDL